MFSSHPPRFYIWCSRLCHWRMTLINSFFMADNLKCAYIILWRTQTSPNWWWWPGPTPECQFQQSGLNLRMHLSPEWGWCRCRGDFFPRVMSQNTRQYQFKSPCFNQYNRHLELIQELSARAVNQILAPQCWNITEKLHPKKVVVKKMER
jgi:hypothetical protein